MTTLSIVLTPEAVGKLHDALQCLGRFSETVSIEARRNKLVFSALNSSKTAHASFTLDTARFCSKYHFFSHLAQPLRDALEDNGRFTCNIFNKALLSVFKGRLVDAREKETAIEKCEITIKDRPDTVECRMIVRIFCRHGVLKTYKLIYESVEVMHALFDKTSAKNRWTISAKVLKEFVEHFGPRTEQLDFYSESGRATFTSYIEQIKDGKEILKHPLRTSITIDTLDFDDFNVDEKLHITINLKDFKAIVIHGDTIGASVSSLYSYPRQPLLFTYDGEGILAEFTLMTISDHRGASATPATVSRAVSPRRRSRSPISALQYEDPMPPPPTPGGLRAMGTSTSTSFDQQTVSQREQRPSPPPPKPTLDEESLFLPQEDEDRRWDPQESGDESEDMLGWGPSLDRKGQNLIFGQSGGNGPGVTAEVAEEQRVAPTQRMSQIRGLFDE